MFRAIVTFAEAVATVAALFGGYLVWLALSSADASAPQQASLAAMGIGVAAVPYFIAATLHRHLSREMRSRDREPS